MARRNHLGLLITTMNLTACSPTRKLRMNDITDQLEKEYRVLLQSLNEGIALVPTKARGRFEANARYAQTRLESLVSPRALDRRSDNTQRAELAAEYWKLLRSLQ